MTLVLTKGKDISPHSNTISLGAGNRLCLTISHKNMLAHPPSFETVAYT